MHFLKKCIPVKTKIKTKNVRVKDAIIIIPPHHKYVKNVNYSTVKMFFFID